MKKAKQGRYEVYTPRDLHAADRSRATRLLKLAIVIAMAGILVVFRHPLETAFATAFPGLGR